MRVLKTQLVEIVTAVLAGFTATNLNSLRDFLVSDQNQPITLPTVVLLTLLVANCAGQVIFCFFHMAYCTARCGSWHSVSPSPHAFL
jgi:ABC-type proline/glycine betaine transport system permease subunit